VNERAKQILAQLEDEHLQGTGRAKKGGVVRRQGDLQLTLFAHAPHPVVDELRRIHVDSMTPLDALNELKRLQQQAGDAG
jgi:DNA mismatch repair protein MutS